MYNTYLIEKLRSSAKQGLDSGDSSDFEKTYNSVKKVYFILFTLILI